MRGFKIQVQLATYTVKFTSRKDQYFNPKENDGLCEPNVKRIYVSSKLSPDCMFTTFFHELMHAIFLELDRPEIAYNEPMIETVSQITALAVKTFADNQQKEIAT